MPFSEQAQIVSVGEDKPSLSAQNLGELNAALAIAQDARIKAEAAWAPGQHRATAWACRRSWPTP